MSLLVNQLGEALSEMKERALRAEAQIEAVRKILDDGLHLCPSCRADTRIGESK